MAIQKRESDASDEGKDNRYLPDEMPEIPEVFLAKFTEIRQWQEDLNEWWVGVKDILMRQSEGFERIFGKPIAELGSTLTDAQELLDKLKSEAETLDECCKDNALAITNNADAITALAESLADLADDVSDILESIGGTTLQEHINATEAHGSDGAVVGINVLNGALARLALSVTNEVKAIHKAKDIGAVDDTTASPIRCPVTGDGKFVRYRFIEISPAGGAAPYVLNVQLGNDAPRGLVVVFFINGVASINPTIRLVKVDGSVIHSEALDGSGDSIRVELVVNNFTGTFKVIQRSTL